MRLNRCFALSMLGLATAMVNPFTAISQQGRGAQLFADDFEEGSAAWAINDPQSIRVIDSGQPGHANVLLLSPAGAQPEALIRGSDRWRGYRIEGDVYFPDNRQNYLGFIYNYRDLGGRTDLGSIYIKGNGSYVQANPRRDWNPGRQLYGEYHAALTGGDSIRVGQWQRFAAEVVGNICHFYVGDMATPKITFDLYEHESGFAGFKPRVVGGPVWIDNIQVTDIGTFSYRGPRLPAGISYDPGGMLTDWEVLGPFTRTVPEAERGGTPRAVVDAGGVSHAWRPFETDLRGAVITGRVADFLGESTVAYFRTTVVVSAGTSARIAFSTLDDTAIWVNGEFKGYGYGGSRAWYDLGSNPDHEANDEVGLSPGVNVVLIRIRGGRYASGGFFARVVRGD